MLSNPVTSEVQLQGGVKASSFLELDVTPEAICLPSCLWSWFKRAACFCCFDLSPLLWQSDLTLNGTGELATEEQARVIPALGVEAGSSIVREQPGLHSETLPTLHNNTRSNNTAQPPSPGKINIFCVHERSFVAIVNNTFV